MDILQLYQDFNVDYKTEGHKHTHVGWVHTPCPFCGNTGTPGYHLGIRLTGGWFQCWRCGKHAPTETISKLLNVNYYEAKEIVNKYIGNSIIAPEPIVQLKRKGFKYPSNLSPLLSHHKSYLQKRGYDPERLEKEWGLLSSSPSSLLDSVNYCHRIIIPINWDGKTVTFQGRDTTGRHPLKYMACPKPREIIHHKHILGGKQECWGNTGIIVEGWFDTFRFGTSSACTFGIEYAKEQVKVIAQSFKRIAVAFDYESQAQQKAKELIAELKFRGRDAFLVDIKDDPGSMSQDEADYLVKQIINH